MLVWILVILVVLICWLYIEFTPRDADPDFIVSQASISPTKMRGESAVFRSLANDHGRALLGSMPPLKNFQFARLWDEVKTFQIAVVSQAPQLKYITNFEELVAKRQTTLESKVVLEENGLEGLVTYFAAMLKGIVPSLPEVLLEKSQPGTGSSDKDDQSKSDLHPALKAAIAASSSVNASAGNTEDSTTNRSAPANSSTNVGGALQIGSHLISEVDLGVAIASQLTAAGTQHRWTSNDTVFVAPGPLTASSLVAMLTALSAKSLLLFAQIGPMLDATRVLEKAKPTIMVTDDVTMRTLAKQRDAFRIPQWLQYGFRRLRLAKGALTKPAMLHGFQSLRLIYSVSGPDPFQWLDNGEAADLRVLTGTQLVHVLAPNDGLPITQTCVGDYRSSKKLPGAVWGPPVPGLELKTQDGNLYVRRANHSKWELVTTVEGPRLMRDGCLYVPVQRPVFLEEYYYTGELN